ncbi:TPR-like protein [Linderina pennispora]|uniref:TPR-like protein n=1 Tax=Linderina pennispora TaxID=61395 RepID=A0A1Y1W2J9_9FUNG|nr:TPR-like protein [Linderina pennispora]ORX67780.1 TPR-like protein [Linderina pennispora]
MDQLLAKAQELMDDNEPQTALQFAAKAIEMDANNTQALFLAALIQLEMGSVDPAINCLQKCVQLSPERGFEKYMYLGQFSVELEAVKYFELGVQAMQRDLAELPQDSLQAAELRRMMAEAYVAITEIFLTDCCDEPDAEQKCEQLLQLAVESDPECPEVYQTLASVRMSQARPDDARECLKKGMSLWINKDPNDPQIPSYDNRLALARLLLEVDEKEEALSLLERLQKQDDENVDLWYLYGWTYKLQAEDTSEDGDKADLLRSARACLRRAIKLAQMQEYEDESLVAHAQELVTGINELVPDDGNDDAEEEVAGNEGEWEDVASDDDNAMDTM